MTQNYMLMMGIFFKIFIYLKLMVIIQVILDWIISDEVWCLHIYQIVFSYNRTGEGELYVIDPTGFNEERLTINGGAFPHCRADGELIVYERNGMIYTMNPDGTNQQYITQGKEPDWSWDGKRIAYSYNGDIHIYNLEEGTNIYVPSPSKSHFPSWSPDDQKLVFESYHNGLKGEAYTVNTDGDSLRRIASEGSYPSWSIENNIVYGVDNGLEVTDSNGNNSSYLFLPRALQPAWSPDGRRIAFSRYPDMSHLTLEDFASVSSPDELNIDEVNIFISDANGNNVIQVTEEGGAQPAWLLSDQTEPKLYGRADYPETRYLTIWSGPLNLRDAPNIDSEVVDKLRTGQKVWFVDEGPMDYRANHNAPWIKVVTQGGIEGYIFSYFSDY
ncbi:MAG: SH3 domain-containing protein [Candidatus Coatesbacteria bacterium]|nr:SH3 domain-containing protein [Candidatus Coatesbacteria bacterium]